MMSFELPERSGSKRVGPKSGSSLPQGLSGSQEAHDRRTRVLIAVTNLEYGGAQRQILELVNNLDPDRYLIHIASLSDYVPLRSQLKADVPVHIVRKRSRFDFNVVLRILDLIAEHRFQILHAYLFDAEIATRVAGLLSRYPVKVIGSERSSNYRHKKIQRLAYRLTRGLFDVSIANSHTGAKFNSEALGIPPDRYRVVHNGVDSVRFRPRDRNKARAQFRIPSDVKLVGVFASFKVQKNHLFLLDAVLSMSERHPDMRLLLVGDMLYAGAQGSSEYHSTVTRMINDTKLRDVCVTMGNVSNVEELYPACDVTVLPSLAEGLPNVILESMSCGVPVIATRVSDNDRIITDGETGRVVGLDDRDSLAAALGELLDNEDLREEMGRKARGRILEHFSSTKLAENTAAVYDELVPVSQSSSVLLGTGAH